MRTIVHPLRVLLAGFAAALVLAGCGGGGSSIGGTLSGLATGATIILQNNGSESLTLTSDGTFEFDTVVADGEDYDVTVLTQPAGQTCTVANGSGTIDVFGSNVEDVEVNCQNSATISGTVSGLAAGTSVTLSNAGVPLAVAVDGPFAFPGTLAPGTTYSVTVTVQPAGRTCTVTNGAGTIAAGVATDVTVACA